MTDHDQLPALPAPYYPQWSHSNEFDAYVWYQMRSYALTAIATERARADALQAELADAVRKTATRCREMALWPQGIDDEQAYYGRMFAEFIEREFKL